MKREALPMIRAARRGEPWALLELGRGYLLGTPPFSLHPDTGLRYLQQAVSGGHPDAPRVLAECATLDQLVQHDLLRVLRLAAVTGCAAAQLKLGLWLITDAASRQEGIDWLRQAHHAGHPQAGAALANVLMEQELPRSRNEAVRLLRAEALAGNGQAWVPLGRAALACDEPALFRHALLRACELQPADESGWCSMVVEALSRDPNAVPAGILAPHRARAALESAVRRGSVQAMLMLGRALAGLDEPVRRRTGLPLTGKLGTALMWLQRAADAGAREAWLALAEVYERHPRLSFSAALRRRYLERAAATGLPTAQMQLGRLLLATAAGPEDLHSAMDLLQPLARQGQTEALNCLKTLVLDLGDERSDHEPAVSAALAMLATRNALLAARLALARAFGLTQHEALTLDISAARRPWGLWVDPGVFFSQRRKRLPRAVPSLAAQADAAMAHAAAVFLGIDPGPAGPEGDYRHRVYTLNSTLNRLRLPPVRVFATARANDLDALRGGRRWLNLIARRVVTVPPALPIAASAVPAPASIQINAARIPDRNGTEMTHS